MQEKSFTIQAITEDDKDWVADFLTVQWGAPTMVLRGKVYDLRGCPGFYAQQEDACVGLITYRMDGAGQCEIMSLDSLRENQGIGSALLARVETTAQEASCTHLHLTTTNDNLHALRFYQRRGYVLAALYPNALAQSRELKPTIPLIGMEGIPLRDELVLEKTL